MTVSKVGELSMSDDDRWKDASTLLEKFRLVTGFEA